MEYLNVQPRSSTFTKQLLSKKLSEALSESLTLSFISSKPRHHSIVFHNVLVIKNMMFMVNFARSSLTSEKVLPLRVPIPMTSSECNDVTKIWTVLKSVSNFLQYLWLAPQIALS